MFKTNATTVSVICDFDFEFVSDFVLRISDLDARQRPPAVSPYTVDQ